MTTTAEVEEAPLPQQRPLRYPRWGTVAAPPQRRSAWQIARDSGRLDRKRT